MPKFLIQTTTVFHKLELIEADTEEAALGQVSYDISSVEPETETEAFQLKADSWLTDADLDSGSLEELLFQGTIDKQLLVDLAEGWKYEGEFGLTEYTWPTLAEAIGHAGLEGYHLGEVHFCPVFHGIVRKDWRKL